MWKLQIPDNSDAMANIDAAFTYVSGKSKHAISAAEKMDIQSIYDEYERLKGAGAASLKGSGIRKDLLKALENSYGEVQKTGRLKLLRDKLFLNARRCPSCGILPVDELDHYLPKAVYQTLSIYASNIVPYCHVCNKHKLASPGTKLEERFIHAYYDDLPNDEQFLFADVWIEGLGLQCKLEVRKTAKLTDVMVKRLNFQMKRVDLQDRVIKELFDFIMPTAVAIKDNYEIGGAPLVKIYLSQAAKQLKKAYGLNDWHPVAMDALANSSDFCDGGFYKCLSIDKSTS